MTQAMPWVFAVLAALCVGAVAVAFWQSVRAMLGLVEEGEVAEERFADADRDLIARRSAILASLRDLDFDHESGKLSDEDHREARLRLRTEAKAVMAAIDAAIAPDRARIEREIDARLAGARVVAPVDPSPAPAPAQARSCASCNAPNDADAAFCKRCGKPLAAEASS